MSSGTLILDVRRAEAEAARQALNSWQPPEDPIRRAAEVERLARRLVGLPRELRDVVNGVFDNQPRDGSILEYMNRHRLELHALFDAALAELRRVIEHGRESTSAGLPVPSLRTLEKALAEAEQVREDTLAHWTEFPEGPIVIDPNDCVPDEEAFKDIEARLSPELRRELQSRLDRPCS
jgi:hypothetical protein